MFRPYELAIGLRYLGASRRYFISFTSLVSIIGVMLGVACTIVVMSVMNGFQEELKNRLIGNLDHINVVSLYRGEAVRDWASLADIVEKHPEVEASAPYVNMQALIRSSDTTTGVLIRGILPQREVAVSKFKDMVTPGSFEALANDEKRFGIVLGWSLAKQLGVEPGQKVDIVVAKSRSTAMGSLPRTRRFTVVGTIDVGADELDRTLAITHIDDAALLQLMRGGVTGLRLKVADVFNTKAVTADLKKTFEDGKMDFIASDWTRSHGGLLAALDMEKVAMFIILSMIIAVAAFNIAGTLMMAVKDKTNDIAILRTLGTKPLSVTIIFMIQGTAIGLIGVLMGVLLGCVVAVNIGEIVQAIEALTGSEILPAHVYAGDGSFPSILYTSEVLMSAFVAFLLTLVSTLPPGLRASRIQPAEALRYD